MEIIDFKPIFWAHIFDENMGGYKMPEESYFINDYCYTVYLN